MFGSKKGSEAPISRPASSRNSGANNGTTLISKSTEVTGDIKFTGSLVVEGTVTGNIVCEEGSAAKLQIFDSGFICGEIRVPTVVINGRVQGDVYASEHVELAAHAVVDGTVHYKLIEMVKGAQVNGSLVFAKNPGEPVITISDKAENKPEDPVITLNDDSKSLDEVGSENGKLTLKEASNNGNGSGRNTGSKHGRRR